MEVIMPMSRTRKVVLIISGIILAIILFVALGVALLYAALRRSEPTIRDNSVLVLRLSGSMPDYVPEDPMRKFFGNDDQSPLASFFASAFTSSGLRPATASSISAWPIQ